MLGFIVLASTSLSAEAADKVKLQLGGYTNWFAGGIWQNNEFAAATKQSFNNFDVKGQSNIIFSGSTKLDNGLDVGVMTSFRAGTNTGLDAGDENNLVDKAYVYVSSNYGKVIIGVLQSAAYTLHVSAPEAIGQWEDNGLLTDNSIIAKPADVMSVNGNGINSTSIQPGQVNGKVEGITYITPTFYGITLGASYIPNDLKNYRGATNTTATIKDMFAIGANYTNRFGEVGVKGSLGWARGTMGSNWQAYRYPDWNASLSGQELYFYTAGLNVSYSGFTVGGSFRLNQHDVTKGGIGNNVVGGTGYSMNGRAWDAGATYATGPWAVGLTYFGSRMDGLARTNFGSKEQITFVQASGKYDLGPGVSLQSLIGYGKYEASTPQNVARGAKYGNVNDGWTALGGLSIQF